MQPEDIIQQKQWKQLTAAEKEIVLPLASTESEYSLLKNILLSAGDDLEVVPLIDVSVHQYLQSQLAVDAKKRSVISIYYYAAASIILAIVASWFIFQFKNNKSEIDSLVFSDVEKIILPVKGGKDTIINMQPKKEAPVYAKYKVKKKFINKKSLQRPANIQGDAWAVNTLINKDENIVSLITEVY